MEKTKETCPSEVQTNLFDSSQKNVNPQEKNLDFPDFPYEVDLDSTVDRR